jgi:hypothetical protein
MFGEDTYKEQIVPNLLKSDDFRACIVGLNIVAKRMDGG